MLQIPHNLTLKSATIEQHSLAVFNGGDGFGQILFFWALMLSLLGFVTLIAIGFAFKSVLAIFCGLISGSCYLYLGHLHVRLLERISP